MLSASFNQTPNQGLRFNLSENPMNDFTSNIGYHDNYIPKPEMYNQFYNQNHYLPISNQDSKMYSISEVDSLLHSNNNSMISNDFNLSQIDRNSNKDFDFNALTSRLQSMGIKSNSNLSRSNSAHNSPFDSRVTPRHFSQSTSNTPLPLPNRLSRDIDMMRGNAPIMQLFPNSNNNNNSSGSNSSNQIGNNSYSINRQSPVELIEYQSMASKMGFLVGQDLDEVLNRSATMKNSNSSRISNFFKHKHGSSGSHSTQKQYLVLGVRVPSKEHVSEIVGKEGKKIKMIRQTTGALIATPNEKEDHVFLIEAVPEIAIKVGHIIQQLADQITRNKLGNISGLMGERPRSPPMLGNRTPLATATIGVPQRLVGKVIGTQGSIITTVQKETGTEIKSPPKDELRAPGDTADFEISVYENGTVNSEETAWLQIHRAKQLIAHLVMRVWDQQPRNSTPSSDEGGHCTPSNSSPEWIWPEVSRMDDGDAKEIIDRILRSSKAKITPSTSSTEGANLDSLVMPAANGNGAGNTNNSSSCSTGMSPPFSLSLIDTSKQSPYKLLPPDDGWAAARDCYRVGNGVTGYSKDGSVAPTAFYGPPQFSSLQPSLSDSLRAHQYYGGASNDSAFYDSYYPSSSCSTGRDGLHQQQLYLSDSGYLIDQQQQMGESPPPGHCANIHSNNGNGNHHHCQQQQQTSSDSWAKPVFYSPSSCGNNNNNNINSGGNHNYTDDSRYGNVKYLWKNCSESLESSPPPPSQWISKLDNISGDQNHNQQQNLNQNHQQIHLRQHNHHQQQQQQQQNHHHRSSAVVAPESLFGTIGDGRKRNSAASNSDDREDL